MSNDGYATSFPVRPPLAKNEELRQELLAEMRWRRDTEFKLLTVHIAVCGAAIALMLQGRDKGMPTELASIVVAVSLATISWVFASLKVRAESDTYQYLGSRVVVLWKELGLFEPPRAVIGDPFFEKGSLMFGRGGGHRSTLNTIHGAALIIIALGAFLASVTLLKNCQCPSCARQPVRPIAGASAIERVKSFTNEELTKRDKANLDIFWLKDEALEESANPAADPLDRSAPRQLSAAWGRQREMSRKDRPLIPHPTSSPPRLSKTSKPRSNNSAKSKLT